MGGNHTRSVSRIDEKNWVPILPNQEVRFHNVNNYAYRALRNIQTNQQIEQYHVEFMSEADYMQYVKQLTIRKEPSDMGIEAEPSTDSYYYLSPFIYTVKYFLNVSMMDLCSTSYKGLLYTKKVDIRLKEINDIPLPDQLYMIRATLEGFKVLYEKMGYFDIIEEMIFIDKAGKVRVWVNPNLSHNEPYLARNGSTREMHGSQAEMIVTLLNLIEDNTDQLYEEEMHFREYLLNKGIFDRLSFHLALQQLEVYCMEKRLEIDDHMPSIEELYYPETMRDEESQHVVRDTVVERNGHGSTIPTISQNRSTIQGKVVTSPVRRQYYAGLEGPKSSMNESQTDKRSNYSTDNIYRSNYDPNQQSSRKVIVIPGNYRQTAPQYNQFPSQPVQPIRNGSGVRQPVTINFPPRPVKHQEEISFRGYPPVNNHVILSSERANQRKPVERTSSVERRGNSTLFKFNYSNSNNVTSRLVGGPQDLFASAQIQSNNHNQIKFASHPVNQSPSSPPQVQAQSQPQINKITHNVQITQKTVSNTKLPTNPPVIIRTNSTAARIVPPAQPQPIRSMNPQVSYYSSDETYNLDSEIAEDLKNYLGYNPSS